MRARIQGLYAITDGSVSGAVLTASVDALLQAGVRILQYRDKTADQARRLQEAEALAALCRHRGAVFIVNDDVDLAAACGADGVHLGRDDAEVAAARGRLGSGAIIGVSCYDSLDRGGRLLSAGADYLAFGAVYPSATKPGAVRAGTELLCAARSRFPQVPLVAIGGITADNAAPVVATGVDAVAVIRGLFAAADPPAAARRIAALFDDFLGHQPEDDLR